MKLARKLPANMDCRSDEEKVRELLLADASIINEFNRRVAANIERRRIAKIHKKWERAA